MSQIKKKFIGNNEVGASKIRLENNSPLRARNAANSADINLLTLNAANELVFNLLPKVSSDPVGGDDLVRKSYLDSVQQGLKPKQAVKVATTANITLSGLQTIDAISVLAGDRVLVKDQSTASQNGIYVAAVGAWSRATDFDSVTPIDEINGAYTFVQQGTANSGKGYVQSGDVTVVGVDPIVFVFFNALGNLVGFDMITISGNNVSVDLAATSGLESTNPGNAGGQLRVKVEASNPSLEINGSNELAVKVDNVSLEKSVDGVRIKDLGVSNSKIASGVDAVKIADGSVDNSEFQRLNGVTSNIQTQLDNKQPLDSTLTALAAYNTNGFLVQTAADTFAGRQFVAGAGINITNPAGAAGDVTIASTITQYTDEQAQDAVGGILVDSSTIDFTYDDVAPSITASVIDGSISTVKIANDAVDKTKINADVAGAGLAQNVDGSLELNIATSSALEVVSDQLRTRVDASTVKINASNNLESLKISEKIITLSALNITNQYVDLDVTAQSAQSISFFPANGPRQVRGVDFSVSLSGGAGGVTRISFIGDLALGGASELEQNDVIVITCEYL